MHGPNDDKGFETPKKLPTEKVLGIARPFRQGGSWRVTIPSRVAKRLGLIKNKRLEKDSEVEEVTLIFIGIDKGILIRPLTTD
jgi:hypothetical protein